MENVKRSRMWASSDDHECRRVRLHVIANFFRTGRPTSKVHLSSPLVTRERQYERPTLPMQRVGMELTTHRFEWIGGALPFAKEAPHLDGTPLEWTAGRIRRRELGPLDFKSPPRTKPLRAGCISSSREASEHFGTDEFL